MRGRPLARLAACRPRFGITRQTVYNRFGDKPGLFAATVERHWAGWGREPRIAQVSPHDPVETQLRAVARSIVAFTDERQLAFQTLIIAESRRDPTLGEADSGGRCETHS